MSTTSSILASPEVRRKEQSSKKRRRDESAIGSPDAEAGAEREESPKKRQKDLQEIPALNGIPKIASQTAPSKDDSFLQHTHREKRKEEDDTAMAEDEAVQSQESPSVGARAESIARPSRMEVVPGLRPSLGETESPFVSVNASFKVTIPPIAQTYPLEGVLANYFSRLLLTYHPQLGGIFMAYNNARLRTKPGKSADAQPFAQSIDECAAPYVWINLDALVFKPKKNCVLEGYVNLQHESHVVLILWNHFTVNINRRYIPRDWKWYDYNGEEDNETPGDKPMRRSDEQWGCWYDNNNNELEGLVQFRIKDWDCSPPGPDGDGSFISIEGNMLTVDEEEAIKQEEAEQRRLQKEADARKNAPKPSALRKKTSTSTPSSSTAVGAGSQETPSKSNKKVKKTKKV